MWIFFWLRRNRNEDFKNMIDLDPSDANIGTKHKKYNDSAVFWLLKRNPNAARQRYAFRSHPGGDIRPLALVVALGASLEVVQLMVEACPEALYEKMSMGQFTPLHYACLTKGVSIEVLEHMVNKCPSALSEKDSTGGTPLHAACKFGASVNAVRFLLRAYPQGACILDDKNKTPLHCACMYGASLDVVTALIEAYPEALFLKDGCGCTPLMHAEINCNSSTQKDLISKVMDVIKTDPDEKLVKETLFYFRSIHWWEGVSIALQKNHGKAPILGLDHKLMPELLPQLTKHCGLKDLFLITSQRPDLLISDDILWPYY